MANTITMADAMWIAGEAVVKMSQKAGIKTNIVDVYQKDSKQLAVITAFIKEYAMTVTGTPIEVTRE